MSGLDPIFIACLPCYAHKVLAERGKPMEKSGQIVA
jgi:hypothetical protein